MWFETNKTNMDYGVQLVTDAHLAVGFIQGTGLGAVLLTIVLLAFIRRQSFSKTRLSTLIKAWRGG